MSGYQLAENVSLAGRNTFRVPARTAMMADVQRADALGELFEFAMLREGPVMVLGEGSNLLFADDYPGVAICLAMAGSRIVRDDGDSAVVRAEAGMNWNDLVAWTLGRGLCGLENLALIPGTVGAAPIQNIGAYGVEVGEFVEAVEAFSRDTGQVKRIAAADCGFGYRDSLFKREADRWVVTALELRLPRRRELRLDYAGVKEELAAMGVTEPRAVHVAEAISRLRTRKLPNPALLGNAGSFFKNPVLPDAEAEALAAEHPGLPHFRGGDGRRKLSAAWMIEACGWKGYREGDAGVSAQHALVLVNHGKATGRQLLDLARRIADSVRERFGVQLEPEPRIVGADFRP
ncbi:UDP-N-acetylmuramate dehydrogenase [Arenimonas fontis]|uniref:UDP-N-acetylenolpyruvoylglucosamine reductase n=1 Tax=Arenimonas fontis TaxID=2608255 RepID=A0A5B2ZBZ1_9GAMM|nr:UDP-N-acetylmuramate dehydrogenase [Arenimonas fontis]KAA2285507.1 UDP-N-acetylmuramate dehydrogenase [Arenimonas fontis]